MRGLCYSCSNMCCVRVYMYAWVVRCYFCVVLYVHMHIYTHIRVPYNVTMCEVDDRYNDTTIQNHNKLDDVHMCVCGVVC